MSLRSMTGFAREAGTSGPSQWAWELKTVNGRGLEIRVRTPAGFDEVGEAARKLVAAKLTRGQCQLTLTLARTPGAARVRINAELLGSLLQALGSVPRPDGIGPASLDGLLAVRGVVEQEDDGQVPAGLDAELKADLTGAAERLVGDLDRARETEGRALSDVLTGQLARMERLVAAAEEHPGRSPEAVRARLASQVAALLDASRALDEDRLYQEAAILATRSDIREELDRLGAHITACRDLVAAGGAVGRRLDFLAQELGRESNTLCAKAGDMALSRIGLDLKAVVEQFREQVQNVE